MTIGTTIVIPTCGPATSLVAVLTGLANQTIREFEVIVVDNNPSARLSGPSIRVEDLCAAVVHEPRNGLSHARNAGVACARGSVVAFLDDDGVPSAAWVQTLIEGMKGYGSAAAGGSVQLQLPFETPPWLGDAERALLSELIYSGIDIPILQEDMYIVGANMCVSREAFERVGLFSSSFGRTATSLRSSEELEFTRRLQVAGLQVSFIASAVVRHQIGPWRVTEEYLVSRAYWQGRSDALLEARWGRPASFGRRGWVANLRALYGRLREYLGEESAATRIRRRLSLAREYGYCLQVALLRLRPAGTDLCSLTGPGLASRKRTVESDSSGPAM
jgi:GT2 family glycosyltransferase